VLWRQVLAQAVAPPPRLDAAALRGVTVAGGIWTDDSISGYEPKKLFHRGGDGRFDDCAFVEGFDSRLDGRSLVAADLDGDGDLDLLMSTRNGSRLQLFENVGASGTALEVELKSTRGHPEADGALVLVDGVGAFPVVLNRGYVSSVDPVVHVGLDAHGSAHVRVKWRSGVTEDFGTVEAGGRVRATEGTGKVERVRAFQSPRPVVLPAYPATVGELPLSPGEGPTVVQLFMQSCKPCRDEVPALNALNQRGVRVVGLGLHSAAELPKVKAAMKMRYEVGVLPEAVAETFETPAGLALPTLLIYGADGGLLRVVAGAAQLPAVLDELKLGDAKTK
jgi:thiol-disulfide isomerase/thioredoxin